MDLRRFENPVKFRDAIHDFILKEEASHNIFFGVLHTLIEQPNVYTGDNYMVAVYEDSRVIGCAYRTPPYHLALSRQDRPQVARLIARDYVNRDEALPGVLASPASAVPFIDTWKQLTNVEARCERRQRIYRLSTVIEPSKWPAGRMRRAKSSERELVLRWAIAFDGEVDDEVEEEAEERVSRWVDHAIKNGSVVVWESQGEPVSMANFRGPTPNGVRISYVYTPPHHRRRGYASACVAALSQKLLNEGRKFCFLFTDLDNATPNTIYQQIGYEPVSDMHMYRFE